MVSACEDVKKSCWPVAADTPPAAGPTPPGGPTPVAGPIPATGPTPPAGAIPAANPAADNPADAAVRGPKGPGWIVRISGYHYHNADRTNQGAQYVRNTLIKKLRDGEVKLPSRDGGEETVKLKDLGITYPVLINPSKVYEETDHGSQRRTRDWRRRNGGHPGLEPGGAGMPRNRPAGRRSASDATGANTIKLATVRFRGAFLLAAQNPQRASRRPKDAGEGQNPRATVACETNYAGHHGQAQDISVDRRKYQFWVLCGVILLDLAGRAGGGRPRIWPTNFRGGSRRSKTISRKSSSSRTIPTRRSSRESTNSTRN